VEGERPQFLNAGDCFVVASNPFTLASDPDVPAVDAACVFGSQAITAVYGVGSDVDILGGSVSFNGSAATDMISLFPSILILRRPSGSVSRFTWLLEEFECEWRSSLPGRLSACNDLLRLMFVYALRQHILTVDDNQLRWLGGLTDPAISLSLRAIHAAPGKIWKLDELASIAHMSRSNFAARFKSRVGTTPSAYAMSWRMRVAASTLLKTDQSISSIAASVGFLSDAAFSATFRRIHRMSPREYRNKFR
jgi:AraC-like DNA-binding protein